MKVKEFMTRDLTSVTPDSSLKRAVTLLSATNLTGIAVVDKEQKVIGFLSEKDLIQAVFPGSGGIIHDSIFVHDFSRILRQLGEIADKKVEDVMTSEPTVVNEEQTSEEVAEIMISEKFKILPVVKAKTNILVGIVTRSDLLKSLFKNYK